MNFRKTRNGMPKKVFVHFSLILVASEGQILIEGIFRLLLFLYLPRGKKNHVDTIFLPTP